MLGLDSCGQPGIVGAHFEFAGFAPHGKLLLKSIQFCVLGGFKMELIVKQGMKFAVGAGMARPSYTPAMAAANAIAATNKFAPQVRQLTGTHGVGTRR